MKNIIEKIKLKIRKQNSRNVVYYTSIGILVAFFLFVLITTIIQTSMVGINELNAPILIWIITQPYVGVFFIPFMLLLSYICWFITTVAKPVTIDKVKSDCRTLFENNEVNKDEYEILYKTLNEANQRKLELIKQKQEEINKLMNEQLKLANEIKTSEVENEKEKDQ